MNKANSSMRDSNMELYRIIAMLMVILLHVFGEYNIIYKQYHTPEHIINILLTCTTFVCVDMFVLLSGWYGINTRWEKIKAFIFQVLFYSIALYIVILTFFDAESFSWRFFTHIFIFDSYWFIPVYLMLYLFAPALNPFIKQSSINSISPSLSLLLLCRLYMDVLICVRVAILKVVHLYLSLFYTSWEPICIVSQNNSIKSVKRHGYFSLSCWFHYLAFWLCFPIICFTNSFHH